ncbi:enoyl-CoA hydratase/carnithine racemase [Novosphingobium chloroacetimidivorans]|uniref:Enoyl-CoA hydratase/carnithine racemase n=1 Tax=Novosphingobium chloroacetimidivorans TaxID=1428314 RepID=A0A7W7NWZ4_9SPHN|nr:enoyl-CoA hydratase/isomerase family protein [Novosphingobium chloroacetimidivorans]MBB4860108.1 enoyl-CoA hydratase/carnithine racemase [Novosphingobium chloroacetimidivorans]
MAIEVSTHVHGAVAEVRFAKPPFNYACPELLRRIADALDRFDGEDAVRATVLVAEGKAFCAGADLAGDESIAGEAGMDAIGGLYVQAERLFRRVKPMVAAVQGAAIGAGLGLALAADFRVAGPAARLSSNFVRLGFHPGFGLTHTLPRLLGPQRAAWMMLSAERVKPDVALAWGLVDRLAQAGDERAVALAMAAEIAANAPLALKAVRATANAGLADAVAAAMRHEHAEQTALRPTADYAEGVASVFERREARWLGR